MLANKLIKQNQKYQTKGRIGYGSKNYANPFFEKKRKSVQTGPLFDFLRKIRIASLIILGASACLAAFALYSGFFTIKDIEINGGGRINQDEVRQIVNDQINSSYIKILPQKNILIFSKDRLKASLESLYSFNSLEIIKKYPKKIQINFKEKTYAFIFKEDGKFYYADEAGSIIEEVSPLEITNKAYPTIDNQSSQKIANKAITLNPDYIRFSLALYPEMKKHEDQFKVTEIIFDDDQKTVKVALENAPRVFFNTESDIGEQIKKLLIIKQEKLKDDFMKKEYIDLRYGDSVYYK